MFISYTNIRTNKNTNASVCLSLNTFTSSPKTLVDPAPLLRDIEIIVQYFVTLIRLITLQCHLNAEKRNLIPSTEAHRINNKARKYVCMSVELTLTFNTH